MTAKQEEQVIKARIRFLRRFCLIHRYLYYVKGAPLVADAFYDERERELKRLTAEHPKCAGSAEERIGCPSTSVGSSLADDYPRHMIQIAESLTAHGGARNAVSDEADTGTA